MGTKKHDCTQHRIYLEPCGECRKSKDDPRKCALLIHGICSICHEIIR